MSDPISKTSKPGSQNRSSGDSVIVAELTRNIEQTKISDCTAGTLTGRVTIIPNSNRSNLDYNNFTQQNTNISKAQLPYRHQTFAKRPSLMIEDTDFGGKVQVETNFFRINFPHEIRVLQYNIEFKSTRGVDLKKKAFTSTGFWYAYDHCSKQRNSPFPDHHLLAFNGVNILYSLVELNLPDHKHTFRCKDGENKDFLMLLKFAGMIALKPNSQNVVDRDNFTNVIGEVLTSRLTCPYEDISNDFHREESFLFYKPQYSEMRKHFIKLGSGVEAWFGLHGAVKTNLQAGLLLNVDVCRSVFYKQGTNLVEFYCEIVNGVPYDERNSNFMDQLRHQGLGPAQRKALENALKGKKLEYRTPNSAKKKIFKFSKITHTAAATQFFYWRDLNRRVSIEEYFYTAFGYRLQCPFLPCICLNKTKGFWLPMEVVWTDKKEIYKVKANQLSDTQLRSLIQKGSLPPFERRDVLLQMAASQNNNDDRNPVYLAEQDFYMKNFGVSVDRRFITANASLLPAPTLAFGEGVTVTDEDNCGLWDLENGATLKKIRSEQLTLVSAIIYLTPNYDEVKYQMDSTPYGLIMEVLHNFGIKIPGAKAPHAIEKFDCFNQKWDLLKEWMHFFKNKVKDEYGPKAIPLVLYIFPYNCATRGQRREDTMEYFSEYAMVKHICDVSVGIHCQGILAKTYYNLQGNPSTCSTAISIALKIIAKIGATLYKIEANPKTKYWNLITNKDDPTLVLGIDVTHPGARDRLVGGSAANSVACVVGNVDCDLIQFEASVRAQNIGQETTFNLTAEFISRIAAFEAQTGKLPNHIVIFRDGLSETQFQLHLYEEKTCLEEACKQTDPNYKPSITYLIMTKRHHTRFFPLKDEDTAGTKCNLKPGTLVESTVTTKDYFDYYLISHHGAMGTSRPNHYYVLWDDWAPSPTFWQNVSYALTHSYVRCSKNISQPAPIMYAHLGAKRAKEYLMAHVHQNKDQMSSLSDFTFYSELKAHMQKHPELKGMIFV